MVLAGIGGTLLERSMATTAADRVIIRETEPPRFVRPFAIAFDPPASLSPVGQAFVELIRAQAG